MKPNYYNEQIYADIHAVDLQLGMIPQIRSKISNALATKKPPPVGTNTIGAVCA